MSCPTTRRYARTLAQAWPREHANPIEHYSRPGSAVLRLLAFITALALIGAGLAQAV